MRQKVTMKEMLKLWFSTLFYNSCLSWNYAMDTALEPLFYTVDHTTVYLGRMFVVAVAVLIGSVVVIAHLLGFPIYWEKSPALTVALIGIGYWFIINLTFNFVQGVRVSPGHPSDPELCAATATTICKKCISPKPPRCHHCSICNVCYLKMDHHCPWMNNCIGHFNHRYFYLSMAYIVGGCVFLMIFGAPIAYRQILLDEDVLPFVYDPSDEPANSSQSEASVLIDNVIRAPRVLLPYLGSGPPTPSAHTRLLFGISASKSTVIAMIYFVALLIIGAAIALGLLLQWHANLISKGETSIELHIHRAQRKILGEKFCNPYDKGKTENWKIFLGLDQPGRSFWRHVLLPSAHVPTGNGYDWTHLLKK